jgi:predicted nuclease of predicted toxin-antitoxin system
MKFLVDMNLSPAWVHFLAKQGFEAIHWSAVGQGTASHEESMLWASDRDYILLTADLDFGSILAATRRHKPSVVQIRGDLLNSSAVGKVLLASVKASRRELRDGALVSIDLRRTRLRILPLER